MRIGELSRRTGVHERLLRYYEAQGLLSPGRRPSGYREYAEADVPAVRRIRSLLAAGLNTATIATILPCLRDEDDRLVPTCPGLLTDLLRERDRITRAIADLQSSRSALDEVIGAAPEDVTSRARGAPASAV
ncbi:MerR family transcriptional regulator [Streptomyces sp. AV19]|uniref:MerR family transcriptional regulator n=1 Tax=Streptomyces sp. AV19 TaxID=2793068 RepID=UPI0018FE1617|nr:MerR family transcriptional regulator [Streptomyces sp. AV19]MBH1938128.1 MerR family transcriptional regulator [Streptomyces sp. AV19]MDG4533937.1 MerR family transcriptional regulator [Streptomyces sp. AV19]